MRKIILLSTLLFSSCTTGAYFNISNDIVGGTDENFTNGVEFGVTLPRDNVDGVVLAVMEQLPAFRLKPDDPKYITHVKAGARQTMYTPDDLRNRGIVEDENPYGGATSIFIKRINAYDKKRLSTELEIGGSGKYSGAEQTQKFVHNDLGMGADPKGWEHQIAAEPVVNLNHTREWETKRVNVWDVELVSETGVGIRLGTIHTDATLTKTHKLGYNVPSLSERTEDFSVYLFNHCSVQGRLHNIYYDGAVFSKDAHTVSSKPYVFGSDTGLAVEKGPYSVKFHYNIRTKDYDEQDRDFHGYGLISFGADW